MASIMTYNQASALTIVEEMRRDPTIFSFASRRGGYAIRAGKFNLKDLVAEFGWERLPACGICETQIAGAGVGAALAGTRPIADCGMSDFAVDAWGQIVLQAAKIHFKIARKLDCPVVFPLRVTGGERQTVHHSGNYANWLANAPGLLVTRAATAADVRGLWRTALRTAKSPVAMCLDTGAGNIKGSVPDGDYTIPFGVADIKREGSDVTIAAIGYWVTTVLEVAEDLAKEGIDAEVWDPRTLIPLDRESLIKSVKKTGAMVVVDQSPKTFGTTGEFIATVAEAITPVPPMARVATLDVPTGAARSLTAVMYPTKEKIISAVKGVLKRKG